MIKDSGERTEFKTGAVRDMKRGVGRMDLLPWYGIIEVSKHCEEGADKYGEHNVDRGIPLHSLCDSAARHLAKFIAGEMDEDHLRAAAWNLLWALNQRTTHPELDDLYSHKKVVEDVKKVFDGLCEAISDTSAVFADGDRKKDIRPLTRDEIIQRCREAQDVYVVSKSEMFRSGWHYLQFANPEDKSNPLRVFMCPLEGEWYKMVLYTPEEFEVYDADPSESLKETKDYGIKPKEPTAIEPLSKELLLGMNGRFVYLVQRFKNSDGSCNFVSVGWVRIKVDDDDIFIVAEDEHHENISQQKWNPSWMNCYITDPKNYKE